MQYRLLALDLDGTLVTSHGGITEAAKQAVWSYIDAGGVVALASGRPTRGLWPAQGCGWPKKAAICCPITAEKS